MVTYKKFTDMCVDILWLHTQSLQTCLWIFCGYIYEVYRHACGYSVVTYTKFTGMPVNILWLHIRSLQACLWIFCGYIYEVYRHACEYSVVTYTNYNFAFVLYGCKTFSHGLGEEDKLYF